MPAKRIGRPPLNDITQKEMAERVNVSVRTLREWAATEGLNIADEAAVRERAARLHEKQATTEDEKEAKLRKLKAEADLMEHKLKVQRGEFVSAAEMNAEGVRIGMAVGTIFAKMPEELPPLLAGQDAATIKKLLAKWQREKRTELSQYQSPIKFDQ